MWKVTVIPATGPLLQATSDLSSQFQAAASFGIGVRARALLSSGVLVCEDENDAMILVEEVQKSANPWAD